MSLPTTISRIQPAALPKAVETEITSLLNVMDPDGTIPARRALTDATRNELQARLANLDGYLAGANPNEIAEDIVKLFVVLVPPKAEGVDADVRMRAYCGVLSDVPPFAVRRAIGDFVRGRAGDGRWAPTAPELRKEALKHAAPWNVEHGKISKALRAIPRQEPDAAQRKRALDHMAETMNQLRAKGKIAEKVSREQAEEQLREWERNPVVLPSLSEAGRRAMGLDDPESGPESEDRRE